MSTLKHTEIEKEVNQWLTENKDKIKVLNASFHSTMGNMDYDPSYEIMIIYEIEYKPTESEFRDYVRDNIDEIMNDYIDVAREHLESELR